jgi:hypothetical protein
MSGGSLDYVYFKVEEAAAEIGKRTSVSDVYHKNPLYAAFVEHLLVVSLALREVEYVLSGDNGEGDADVAIRLALGLREDKHV